MTREFHRKSKGFSPQALGQYRETAGQNCHLS